MALIEIVPTTTMEEVLRAYPSANVELLQRYHVGGCESHSHSHTPTEMLVVMASRTRSPTGAEPFGCRQTCITRSAR